MAYGKIACIGTLASHLGTCTNDTVLMTDNNLVCFTSRLIGVTAAYNGVIATLPSIIPNIPEPMRFVAGYWDSTGYKIGLFDIRLDRTIMTRQALNNAEVYLDGVVLNYNNQYYNSTIGNNDESNFTSPVDAR